MTTNDIDLWLNKGLISKNEAIRFMLKLMTEPYQHEDDEHLTVEGEEADEEIDDEDEENCADVDVSGVDFSEIEI